MTVKRLARILVLSGLAVFLSACATSPEKKALALEYVKLAENQIKAKDEKGAAAYYRKALEFDPELREVKYSLSILLMKAKEFREALALLNDLSASDPDNSLVKEARAYALALEGNKREALSIYRGLAEKDNYRESVLYNLFVLADELKQYEVTRKYSEDLVKLSTQKDIYKVVGLSALRSGEEKEARRFLGEYEAGILKDANSLIDLAKEYVTASYFSWGLELLDKVLVLDANNVRALLLRSSIFWGPGKEFVRAKADLDKALSLGVSDKKLLEDYQKGLPEDRRAEIKTLLDKYEADRKKAPSPSPSPGGASASGSPSPSPSPGPSPSSGNLGTASPSPSPN